MNANNKKYDVLRAITSYKKREGEYPTLQQLCNLLGLKSVSTIHGYINELIDENQLVKVDTQTGYELPESDEATQTVPILGYIAAGKPIEAIEDSAPQTTKLIRKSKDSSSLYALRVKGDSMVEDGIFDGDVVVIKKQDYAFDGQTVVAIVDGDQATLKRIYKEKKGFRLQPANQSMLPIFVNEVEIRGIIWEIQPAVDKEIESRDITNKKVKSTLRTLDLFAGIGGIRIGFERAGFKTVFANDFEKNCKTTYDLNFKDAKLVVEDITKIEAVDLPNFDFLLGGFPCQAFSIAGYRHGFDDQKGRGNLFFDIARILDARKPKGFLLENVKNLKTHYGGNTFKVIKETLAELGYHIKYKVLNSMEYGNVPQNRERIYIVGFRDKKMTDKFEFPEPIKLTNNIKDILEAEVDEKYYYNGKPLHEHLKDDVNEKYKVYQWRRRYVRENKKGVSPTLTANMGMGGHNVPIIFDGKGIRKLTPRECARIQGFPDTFVLPKIADSALYKQLGNSVSVPVLERIAHQMAKAL